MAAGFTLAAMPAAHAAPIIHNVDNNSVTCNEAIGKIKFGVPLVLGGTTPNTVTIGIKSTDCVDNTAGVYDATTNPSGNALKGMSSKGVLNSTNNDCLGLQGLSTGTTGSIVLKWSAVPQTPKLNVTSSTFTVTQTWAGTFNDGGVTSGAANGDGWGAQYGYFAVGGPGSGRVLGSGESYTTNPSVTGAYKGPSGNGSNTKFEGATRQSVGSAAAACFSGGVKGIEFGIGGLTTN
jgi:hypothetical protein